MNAGASNADEDAEVPARPSWVYLVWGQRKKLDGDSDSDNMYIRLFFLQSAQTLFDSSFSRLLIVSWFDAALLSGRRDMMTTSGAGASACRSD